MVGKLGVILLLSSVILVGVTAGLALHKAGGQSIVGKRATVEHPQPLHEGWQGEASIASHRHGGTGNRTGNVSQVPGKPVAPPKPIVRGNASTVGASNTSTVAPGAGWTRARHGRVGTSNSMACSGVPVGRIINELFDNHDMFKFRLEIYPENMTVKWIINAANSQLRDLLVEHIEQMKCIVSRGGTPRPQDPLFQLDALISSKYVNLTIIPINETAVAVVKTAENQCAFEVIKLHAEVVKGFFELGRVEASKLHEVPDEVYSLCKPYLADAYESSD